MMFKTESGPWINYRRPNPAARLRLFCFPYAGGGASLYRPWADELPANVEVCPVQLPGRERRLSEPAYSRLDPLVEVLAEELHPLLDLPFAFFGHSMGALIAFELARELRRTGRPQPVHLFVSGRRAPHIPESGRPTHLLPDSEFLEEIRRMNGTPPELLESPEVVALLLPILRTDLALCETYVHYPERPLDCPVSVFGGYDDPEAPHEDLPPWREATTRECRVHMFPGDHFFLHAESAAFVRCLSEDLADALQSPAGSGHGGR